MRQPKTLGVLIPALLLLMGAGFAPAQCLGNGEDRAAVDAFLTDEDGEPAASKWIEDNFAATIDSNGIFECLVAGEPLVNHVIDYRDYVEAWEKIELAPPI